jgi:hypothetical protein
MFNQAARKPNSAQDVKNRLDNISSRFAALHYVAGTIDLALNVAQALDPEDKALEYALSGHVNDSDPRATLLRLRQECYGTVVDALARYDEAYNQSLAEAKRESTPLGQGEQRLTTRVAGDDTSKRDAAKAKRDDAFRIAISSDDELFHNEWYNWHVKHDDPERAKQLLEVSQESLDWARGTPR